jgi:hypothetical protein
MFFYLYIGSVSNLIQFHYHLIIHQILHKILLVFVELSNNNEIMKFETLPIYK